MTKQPSSIVGNLLLALLLFTFVLSGRAAQANDTNKAVKLELYLIWGTNDAQSPDPKHKPVEADLARRMANSPFKWKNYFEVNRQQISVAGNAGKSATMSPQCTVNVTNLADGKIEVTLIGKGKQVHKEIHPLASGLLLIGGDASNHTGWFVVVKEVK